MFKKSLYILPLLASVSHENGFASHLSQEDPIAGSSALSNADQRAIWALLEEDTKHPAYVSEKEQADLGQQVKRAKNDDELTPEEQVFLAADMKPPVRGKQLLEELNMTEEEQLELLATMIAQESNTQSRPQPDSNANNNNISAQSAPNLRQQQDQVYIQALDRDEARAATQPYLLNLLSEKDRLEADIAQAQKALADLPLKLAELQTQEENLAGRIKAFGANPRIEKSLQDVRKELETVKGDISGFQARLRASEDKKAIIIEDIQAIEEALGGL